jgi:dipeptidyl aminopeptidase/acylaminoacyl peptidase
VRAGLHENSPLTYVHPGLPPFLLVQGSADKTVPYEQSVKFRTSLKAANVTCDLITITNGQHRIADWVQYDPAWQGRVISWLQQALHP